MTEIYHVNFHTFRNEAIFLDYEYDRTMRGILAQVIQEHNIVCFSWTITPTHLHAVVLTFADFTRAHVVQLLKGASSHAFLQKFPDLHAELGGHLWQKGYDWVPVTSFQQYRNVLHYVDNNRKTIGLEPLNQSEAIELGPSGQPT